MSNNSTNSIPQPPLSFLSQQESKPNLARKHAYKQLRTLQIDSLFINTNKNKRRYAKVFPSVKIRTSNHFENSNSFQFLKKQKSFSRVETAFHGSLEYIPNILKIKSVKEYLCPFLDVDKRAVQIFRHSSSLRKKLWHLGMHLRSERSENPHLNIATFLKNLSRFKALTSLYLFNFSSPSPLREKGFSNNIKLGALETLALHFIWMGKAFLTNTTNLISSYPSLKELIVTAVEWKFSETDREFDEFLFAIRSLKKLTKLKLTNILTNTRSQGPLFDTISHFSNLRNLTLGVTSFTKEHYASLEQLCENLINLRVLYFEFDNLELYPEFFKHLQKLKALEEFHLKASFEESFKACLPEVEAFLKGHPQLLKFSFLVFNTPNLEIESLEKLFELLSWCKGLQYVDFRIRKLDFDLGQTIKFENLGKMVRSLKQVEELNINLHLWDPINCNLQSLAQSLRGLERVQTLSLNLPLIKENCTETLLMLCKSVSGLKTLRSLKIEFCLDESINLETYVFDYLLERLPKLKDFSITYHDLTRSNDGSIVPYNHLEKKAIQKHKLSSFILVNVVNYIDRVPLH